MGYGPWGHKESDTTERLNHHRMFITFDSTSKESAYNAGDPGLIPRLGRSPGEGNGSPPQYFCLENSTDRGAWWAMVHGVTKSQTRLKGLSTQHSHIGAGCGFSAAARAHAGTSQPSQVSVSLLTVRIVIP